jgi:hypothetical protein
VHLSLPFLLNVADQAVRMTDVVAADVEQKWYDVLFRLSVTAANTLLPRDHHGVRVPGMVEEAAQERADSGIVHLVIAQIQLNERMLAIPNVLRERTKGRFLDVITRKQKAP